VIAAALGYWAFAPRPIEVESSIASLGPFVLTIDEDGVTRVRDRYAVTAPVAGTLLRPNLHAGDRVARDDILGRIVPNVAQMLDARTRAELAARVESAAARVDRAGAIARQSAAALAQAENEQGRIEKLAKEGYASQTERERAALSLDLKRKDLDAVEFERDAAQHDLEQARAALRAGAAQVNGKQSAWLIRSPIAGQVLRVQQDNEGAIGIGGAILELGDTTRLEAWIDLLSTEATRVSPGASVDLDAGGGIKLSGRVRVVEPAARTKLSALGVEEQRVNVIVDVLPNASVAGRIGDAYRVDAKIEIERRASAVTIPTAALFRSGENWAVFKIVDGRAKLTTVRLDTRSAERAVIAAGVTAGERVILYPSDRVRDGSRVAARDREP
jgi:HlyD family secretion protein